MIRFLVHYGIHFIVPIAIAWLFYRKRFKEAVLILWLGIIIDLDHLWAIPIFDPDRCSIGFHTLHTFVAFIIYLVLFVYPKTRIYGLALLLHLVADSTDCLLMSLQL